MPESTTDPIYTTPKDYISTFPFLEVHGNDAELIYEVETKGGAHA